jgi:aspartyl-tRNA(Asn)/glutamyl-tRNA(Gln) amidotransferase subunit A
MQKGIAATAGSRMLEGFVAPFDATVVTRLVESGASIVGRAAMDEFGAAGLFGTEALTEAVSAVSNGIADVALCNDYTGATNQAAAAQGLCYIRPTYGTVSRYGLIPAVPSMDSIGVVCKSLETGFQALSIIIGYDEKDGAMLSDTELQDSRKRKAESEKLSQLRVAVTKNKSALNMDVFGDISESVELELEYSDVYGQIMQILCCAELSNNISRYDGIKFGYRTKDYSGLRELYTRSRTEAFGSDVKLTAMLGAMVLSADNYSLYYDKAMRLRRLIKESLKFDNYDVIAIRMSGKANTPAAHGAGGSVPTASTAEECLTCCSRENPPYHMLPYLCGLPAVITPDFMLMANAGNEDVIKAVFKAIGKGL